MDLHSHHNTLGMDHDGHGNMDMSMCKMNMLFTWDSENLCIVFPSWRITGSLSLILSLIAIVLLSAGYEALRAAARRHDAGISIANNGLRAATPPPEEAEERRSLLRAGRAGPGHERTEKIIKALFYAGQVFYSFFIMLLFMTYNGWVMIAVAVGAFVGFLLFGEGSASKTVACH